MDEINRDFVKTDAVLVIGANDIVNPGALDDTSSAIYGMRCSRFWKATTVVVLKRGMAAGYAGVENPLFYLENTRMLFATRRRASTASSPHSREVADDEDLGRLRRVSPFAGAIYGKQRVRMRSSARRRRAPRREPGRSDGGRDWEQVSRFGRLASSSRRTASTTRESRRGRRAIPMRPSSPIRARRHGFAEGPRRRDRGPLALEAALPDGMRLFGPPMAKQGETWVSAKTSGGVAWFVTDAILNEPRFPPGIAGFVPA